MGNGCADKPAADGGRESIRRMGGAVNGAAKAVPLPPPLFFGSVDFRRVRARFLRSVDSNRVEIF
jgi:hypothetical protein